MVITCVLHLNSDIDPNISVDIRKKFQRELSRETIKIRKIEAIQNRKGLKEKAYNAAVKTAMTALEKGLLPDSVIRRLTRLLLAARLRSGYHPSSELQLSHLLHFVHCTYYSSLSIASFSPYAQQCYSLR